MAFFIFISTKYRFNDFNKSIPDKLLSGITRWDFWKDNLSALTLIKYKSLFELSIIFSLELPAG